MVMSQNIKLVDSLKTLINEGKEDTMKARNINDLVWHIKFSNPDSSLVLLDQSEALSKKLDFADGLGNSYNIRAIIYTVKGDYTNAMKYYNLAQTQFERINDANGISFCLSNIAICFEYQSLFDSSLVYNKKALAIREKYSLGKGIAMSNINIGVLYFNMGFYHISLKHYLKALNFYENKPEKTSFDRSYLGSVQNNIGNIYLEFKELDKASKYLEDAKETYKNISDNREMAYLFNDLGTTEQLLKNYSKANDYYIKALNLATEIDEKSVQVVSLLNISSNFIEENKMDSAIYYTKKGILAGTQINDKKYLNGLYKNMGQILFDKGLILKAIKNFQKALELSEEAGIIKQKDEILFKLSECYVAKGNYKKANEYLKLHIEAANLVLNKEKHLQITEMEAIYQNEIKSKRLEQKEAENRILQIENEIQAASLLGKNRLIASISIGLILIFGILVMLFIQYRNKTAAYQKLVDKNIEILGCNNKNGKKKEELKNGELFELLEGKMKNEELYKMKELDTDKLIEILNTNRTYISQAIKDHAGKNVRQYINDYRIKEAMEMLSNQEYAKKYSIEAIAGDVGFKSISVFNSTFKKSTGVTPSFFRDKSKKI